jgi:SAM-dependent methyltransferase
MSETAAARYVMGHNDRERRRLALQATILQPCTENLMRRAGVSPGMHVLDVGCGVGDVTLLVASLVGRDGSVTSLDLDPGALAIVEQRAAERGLKNISVVQGSLDEYRPGRSFDAVTGRHILIHVPNPLAVLKQAFQWLRPGGVAVFQEYDFSGLHTTYPPCPLRERVVKSFGDAMCADGMAGIGTRLFHLFWEAGFAPPDCRAEYPVDGGPDSPFYEWIAESFRSIRPHLIAKGLLVECLEKIDLDTLADQLREEAVSRKAGAACPIMVGGFARRP